MPDVYGFLLDAELRKAFDVWSGEPEQPDR
ncbi:hypothetical protein SBADM41S_08913 [Streptomyces badius]